MIPQPPYKPVYAIALRYLEAHRYSLGSKSRPRSDDHRRNLERMTSMAQIAADLGYGAGLHAWASAVVKANPVDSGPQWLHDAAAELEQDLERRRVDREARL